MYRIKPSKPAAVFGAVFGAVIVVVGIVAMIRSGKAGWPTALWAVAGVAIISFNLWAAFSRNGSTGQVVSADRLERIPDDEPAGAGRR